LPARVDVQLSDASPIHAGDSRSIVSRPNDIEERLWLMVHSGSRGLGQAIRAAHVAHAERSRSGLLCIRASTPAGQAYLRDMQWARRFAAASRSAMLQAVGRVAHDLFGWTLLDDSLFDCDHNHVNEEEHFGAQMFVHRKGAMAAWPDQAGIVPGSMAAPSFHVNGRGVPDALCSSRLLKHSAEGESATGFVVTRSRIEGISTRYVEIRRRSHGGSGPLAARLSVSTAC